MKFCSCGKEINIKSIQCQKCYLKEHNQKGKNHPRFVDGRCSRRNNCIGCGKELAQHSFYYKSKRCKNCYIIFFKKNPPNIGKLSRKKLE